MSIQDIPTNAYYQDLENVLAREGGHLLVKTLRERRVRFCTSSMVDSGADSSLSIYNQQHKIMPRPQRPAWSLN